MCKFVFTAIVFVTGVAFAHSGGTDVYGCHVNNSLGNGDHGKYHCHKGCYEGQKFTSKAEGLKYILANGGLAKNAVCTQKVVKK